ncbi:MAG: hypothetical protein M1490_00015 [Candidatus Bathyarchaeota archaeon]|nr:hypothetical protein [Candidatus Bathyarchaeota archaeon]
MIVKCSHCQELFSNSDFNSHTCDKQLKECKTIEVSEIIDGSYGNKKLINGWGTNGILYTFEVVPRKAIPLMEPLSRRKVTTFDERDETDEEVPVPTKKKTVEKG